MADYIYAIVKYPALYSTLRKNGLAEIDNIKWEYAGQKVRSIYNDLVP
jgi:glycosyltransferase involved in cell wall biosynthesis